MYIGKVGTVPVIHATQTTTDLSTIAVTERIANTSFHSGDTIIHVTKTGEYTGSDFYSEHPRYPSGTYFSYQQTTLASTTLDSEHGWLIFAKLGSGNYSLLSNTFGEKNSGVMFMLVDRGESIALSRVSINGITTIQVTHLLGEGIISSTSANKLTVEAYSLDQLNLPNLGEILIGNGQFLVGGVDLTTKSFLNTSIVNVVDKIFPPYNFQLLNSTNQLSNSELGINRFSIGSTYNGTFYPIFGDEVNCTSTLVNTTTYATYTTSPSFTVSNILSPLLVITNVEAYDDNISGVIGTQAIVIPVKGIFDGSTTTWLLYDGMSYYEGYRYWAEVVSFNSSLKTFSIKLVSHVRVYDEIQGGSNYYNTDIALSCIGYEYN